MDPYVGLRCTIPTNREEELAEMLSGWPVLGAEFSPAEEGLVTATIFMRPSPACGVDELAAALERWDASDLHPVSIEAQDWLEAYREHARPFAVGRTWWIDPRLGRHAQPPEGRCRLVIEPRSAFGSGSHESTQLVLEAIEDMDLRGLAVLDVGTGSGILSIASDRLGAREVVAIDIDQAAVWVARETMLQQSCPTRVRFLIGPVACLARLPFDVALCNMVSSSFLPLAADIRRLLARDGQAVFSGILEVESDSVAGELERAGYRICGCSRRSEWVCLETEVSK